ncbi:MAG: S8 family serine peptidase [Eubacterium sp.]
MGDNGEIQDDESSENGKLNFSDREIVVGIMDSGVDTSHEVFADRYIESNVNFSTSGKANSSNDDNGHGTSVASVVVKSTEDNVKIKSYKVLDSAGTCSASEVVAACEYILAQEDKPDIINISFTGYAQEETVIENEVVGRLVDAGITVCVAAGNDFVPASYASPAGSDKVITVGSYSKDNSFSSFSCYGDAVDISAPGENIYCAKKGGGYTESSGTSFSAPFVSSACTYIMMQNPNMSPYEIKEKIKDSAINMGDDESYYFGAGMLNFSNLLETDKYSNLEISAKGGTYFDNVDISFSNIPEDAKLYYTLDRTVPKATNGMLYTSDFTLDTDTLVTYALIKDGEYVSDIKSEYYVVKHNADEGDFTIDSSGKITSCISEYKNIVVPESINGIVPTSVGKDVFKDSDVVAVEFPDSVKSLGESCFENCKSLKYVTARGVENFTGNFVFYGCSELRQETMPNLKKGSESGFYGCSKLHYVDFEESLQYIDNMMFAKSGILSADFSKLSLDSTNSYNSFKETPISSCDITGCEYIQSNMFSGCKFLKELKCSGIKEILPYAFKDCNMLKSIDASQVEKLYANSLDSSYFDVFYAPKCTTVDGGKSPFSKYSYIKVLDLPALTDKLCSKWMVFSTVEELYLDSVTELSSACFTNTPKLNVLYLPNAENFHAPYVNTLTVQALVYGNEIFKEKPPMKIVWIPKADIMSTNVNIENAELFFAPSSNMVHLTISDSEKSPVIVVSPDIWSVNFSVINYSDYDCTVISAFDCCVKKLGYNFVECQDVKFAGEDGNGKFVYEYGDDNTIEIPSDFVKASWGTDSIDMPRENSVYQFVLDTDNNNIINAKDYAMILKKSA